MEVYDTIIILKPTISTGVLNTIKNNYYEYLTENNKKAYCEVTGIRKLAYEIESYAQGIYILFTYEAKSWNDIINFEKLLRNDKNVLKYLSIRLSEEEAINKLYSKLKLEQNKIDAWDVLYGRAKYY